MIYANISSKNNHVIIHNASVLYLCYESECIVLNLCYVFITCFVVDGGFKSHLNSK